MCGICGELRFQSRPSVANWKKLSTLMQRRGPDAEGLWKDDHCTLAFRRLAILDLSPSGHQPMHSQNGRWVLVYNGELYNYKPIRHELEQLGWRFRSSGDTEVVLNALAEWGTAALDRFNGMFALGFYDVQTHELLLAIDHAGIKPLYVLHHHEGVFFASQYNQILAHPWAQHGKVSGEALSAYFLRMAIPAPHAILDNTTMLEAGTWLKINADGGQQQQKYYTFPKLDATLAGHDAYAAVDAAVTDAVRRQLMSDVPLGTFLSGGIDSPLVTAKAGQLTQGTIRSYSIGTTDPATDESDDASFYARELGVQHTLQRFTPEMALSALNDAIDASGEPFAEYSILPTLLVAKLARQDVTVILSGDGGDELFWGYTRMIHGLRYSTAYHLPSAARRLLAMPLAQRRPYTYDSLKMPTLGAWYQSIHSYVSEARLASVFPTLPILQREFDFSGASRTGFAQWMRHQEFSYYLPKVLLKMDRGSMYHSLETRVPLLDKNVIAVAAQVDWQSCVNLGKKLGKVPLRQALSQYTSHQSRKKRGFSVPIGQWLRTSLRNTFQDMVLPRQEFLGYPIDANALKTLYDAHQGGDNQHSEFLWALLSLAMWEESHFNNSR